MAGAWTTIDIRDANGDPLTMRAWDESGTGAGPMSFGQVFSDGTGAASQPGQVGSPGDVIDVTLTLDTNAYADGDVMADTQVITNAMRISGGHGLLQSVQVLDEDDQGASFDILFLNANNSVGTENMAPSISDANARTILGRVRVESSEYIDLGGAKMATKTGLGLMLEASGSRDLYIATIIRGAATFSASGVRLKLGMLWD